LGGRKEGNTEFHDVFREQMAALGYVEGRNLIIDTRFGDNREDRAKLLAEELTALHPNVIVAAQGQALAAAFPLSAIIPVRIAARSRNSRFATGCRQSPAGPRSSRPAACFHTDPI
jgi:putative ABC transport system substrate-binding protein